LTWLSGGRAEAPPPGCALDYTMIAVHKIISDGDAIVRSINEDFKSILKVR